MNADERGRTSKREVLDPRSPVSMDGSERRPLIAVVDYRMGNLRSLVTSLERAGAGGRIVTGPEGLDGADGLLLPGVGAFAPAMANLTEQGLVGPVLDWAHADRPFLAVCVGMQLLFEESNEGSNEDGVHEGLGLVPGRVRRLPEGRKIPEMGWNTIELARASRESVYGASLADGGYYYFAHSFCAFPGTPCGPRPAESRAPPLRPRPVCPSPTPARCPRSCTVLATTTYGVEFASVVGRGTMLGTQFHPEKSAEAGLAILRRFVEVAGEAG